MAEVWRLEEYRSQWGVYRRSASFIDRMSGIDLHTFDKHPGPGMDSLLSETWALLTFEEAESFYFGFASVLQYFSWFHTEGARRAAALWRSEGGDYLVLRRYQVPDEDFHAGAHQAIFRRERAVLLEERSPDYA